MSPTLPTKKRKAEDGAGAGASASALAAGAPAGGANGQPKPKKRKPAAPGGGGPSAPGSGAGGAGKPSVPLINPNAELTQSLLVRWLRASPGATTRDCIQYFQPCLTDEEKKKRFTALVKEVASLKGGVLALKSEYAHVV